MVFNLLFIQQKKSLHISRRLEKCGVLPCPTGILSISYLILCTLVSKNTPQTFSEDNLPTSSIFSTHKETDETIQMAAVTCVTTLCVTGLNP